MSHERPHAQEIKPQNTADEIIFREFAVSAKLRKEQRREYTKKLIADGKLIIAMPRKKDEDYNYNSFKNCLLESLQEDENNEGGNENINSTKENN